MEKRYFDEDSAAHYKVFDNRGGRTNHKTRYYKRESPYNSRPLGNSWKEEYFESSKKSFVPKKISKIFNKFSPITNKIWNYLSEEYFLLILIFIISFFNFGLYLSGNLTEDLLIFLVLVGVNLWVIKEFFEGSDKFTKFFILLVVLFVSFSFAESYSSEIFENIGLNQFIVDVNSGFDFNSLNSNVTTSENQFGNSTESLFGIIDDFTRPPDTYEVEQLIFEKTNDLRQSKGLRKLTWDSSLAKIAREHSLDMGESNFFSHTNLQGQGPTQRAESAGISTRVDYGSYYKIGIGENISMVPVASNVVGCSSTHNEKGIASCAFSGWVKSPGHYKNMIDSDYSLLGVGVAIVDGEAFLTQNFK